MASAVDWSCDSCSLTYFDCIKRFHEDDNASVKFFVDHGVIFNSEETDIPNCDNKLTFDENHLVTFIVHYFLIMFHIFCIYTLLCPMGVSKPPWVRIIFLLFMNFEGMCLDVPHFLHVYLALLLWGGFAPSNPPGLGLYPSYSWTSEMYGSAACASNVQHYQMRMATSQVLHNS